MRKFAINQICLKDQSFEQAVEATARSGFHAFTPWYDYISHLDPAAARRIILDAGLEVSGFCNCGLFALKGPQERQQAIDEAKRNIEWAAELGAPSIVAVAGGLLPGSTDLDAARDFAFDCLAETLQFARTTPVTMALEILHPMYTPDWSVVTTLKTANDWCDRLGDGIGLAVDTYHSWWDPERDAQLERAALSQRIATYHISDWLVPTSHLLLDRGMPGEGVIDLAGFDAQVTGAGYAGPVEVEIFSERLWQRPPAEFLADLLKRCQQVYGA
ncbi:sugar phosphate isomerase/epimerase family protein [Pseudohoeflea coraliihabitans]|uniref:Sugar phosphate isomerase/epimerase n=1 Tax=Pseudohoeflea coraliihabitans TaxID=2860393 RepID=A0ABS6WJ80_9HYPH|nr:sugar phosphate isomerase/epimerase family protein [Pseudohoeflea sp. DP4N28-3]MBW3096001.1 sugar phosphate isomerase/epimerase [Pseudohoeflea sp. DP4N28-3]